MSLPQLYITVKGQPLWPEYAISEFRVNITNASSGSLLDQMIVTNNGFENNIVQVQINESLLMFTIDQWYTLTISVSAVSPLYNEGKPNQTSISILRSKCTSLGVTIKLPLYINALAKQHVTTTQRMPNSTDSKAKLIIHYL